MRLFLLMVVVTALEVMLITKIGAVIGFWLTLLLIIGTALIGSQQLKKQWRFVMGKLQSLQSEPSTALIEAFILLICGVLLVTPGFLTDIVGFLGLVPVLRERMVAFIKQNSSTLLKGQFQVHTGEFDGFSTQKTSSDSHTIDGEFERKD